jgi:hypothetical protein
MKIDYKINWKLYKNYVNTSVNIRMPGILDSVVIANKLNSEFAHKV